MLAAPLAAGLLTVGALSGAGLVSAPAANASCVSVWGIGNSASCTSTLFSVAIAIGTGAQAQAGGLFGAAFTVGDGSSAATTDAFAFALNAGTNGKVKAGGLFAIAANLGPNSLVTTEGSGSLGNLGLNIAVSASPSATLIGSTKTRASGIGNIAVNILGGSGLFGTSVQAEGKGNIAAVLGGNGNNVQAGKDASSLLNTAFAIGGGNVVQAGPGPFAIAGSIAQDFKIVKQSGPGIHINGFQVGGAAAVNPGKGASAPRSHPAPSAGAHKSSARK